MAWERDETIITRYRDRAGKIPLASDGKPVKIGREWWATHVMHDLPNGWARGLENFTSGNKVTPLIDGAAFMEALYDECQKAGEYVLVTGWDIDIATELKPGTARSSVRDLFFDTAGRGVQVRLVLWDRYLLSDTPRMATCPPAENSSSSGKRLSPTFKNPGSDPNKPKLPRVSDDRIQGVVNHIATQLQRIAR